MPVYEYRCPRCEHRFEELVPSVQAADRIPCPSCHHQWADRLLSLFAAHAVESSAAPPSGSACGRCGDPNGPCGWN